MDIVKKPLFWILASLVIAFVVVLGIYQEIAISFAVLSIMISTFFASRSLKLANESLKLTRHKIRPFLYVQTGDFKGGQPPKAGILNFEIKNSGVLPGEVLNVEISYFDENEIVTIDNESKVFPAESVISPQPVIFPNASYFIDHQINLKLEPGVRIWEAIKNGRVKTRHRIRYKDKNNEYLTIQTEQLIKVNENILRRAIVSPQYWT
ncbi:MAG: hypothetical protein A2Y90_01435 [Chloroflexi bacterium RBG_13_52_12]|nr:MAG: hypothetical protein A2Y90_01435 [Chloroflexi bacterium RBG_13_52_12]